MTEILKQILSTSLTAKAQTTVLTRELAETKAKLNNTSYSEELQKLEEEMEKEFIKLKALFPPQK